MTVRKIPKEFMDSFSMQGYVEIIDNFHAYTTSTENYYTVEIWKEYLQRALRRGPNYYGQVDQWLYKALEIYSIKNQRVLIFGSAKPWYEAICCVYKCKSCTVIEYNVPDFDIVSNLSYVHVDDIQGQYDVGFSISTFEHSGLGRYGEPIDPDADLKAMQQAKTLIKPKGKLFLSVPVSFTFQDTLEWNAMRVYGAFRLPTLLNGWKVLRMYTRAKRAVKDRYWYQPLFVLENEK